MAEQIIQMLEQSNKHYMVVRWKNTHNVYRIVHLEDNHCEKCQVLRWWYFDEVSKRVAQTNHRTAPNGELDLLTVYADDLEVYGTDSWFQIEWH